jgi:integrase
LIGWYGRADPAAAGHPKGEAVPARKPAGLPPGARVNAKTGAIYLQFPITEDGCERRLSARQILGTEPRSYANAAEARAGHARVVAFIDANADRKTTVRGFWDRWTNEDDWNWGSAATGRNRDSFVVYSSRTRRFVERYAARQIATIVEADVRAYMSEGKGVASQLPTISLFFRDAMTEDLIAVNPAEKMGRKANRTADEERRRQRSRRSAPRKDQIDAMLERATAPAFPRSFYGWLLTGTETGMRGGEIDGMEWEHLDGDVYHLQRQLHYRSRTLEDPKHGSFRKLLLPPSVLSEVERQRDNGSRYIWTNTLADPWMHDARSRWWHYCTDGGPAPRSLVGGATMYQATRHHWAWHALNVLKMPVPDIARLYGHSDGGKTLLEHYADVDNDSAIEALRAARAAQPSDLGARRRAA